MQKNRIKFTERNSLVKGKLNKMITIVLFIISAYSCSKPATPPINLTSVLISATWQLVSSTNFNDSGKAVARYQGLPGDSVVFLFGSDQSMNVVPTYINSYIGGQITKYSYSESFTSTGSASLILAPIWKAGYSDSLNFINYSNSALIFKVNYNSNNVSGYEIDSLKMGRPHY